MEKNSIKTVTQLYYEERNSKIETRNDAKIKNSLKKKRDGGGGYNQGEKCYKVYLYNHT